MFRWILPLWSRSLLACKILLVCFHVLVQKIMMVLLPTWRIENSGIAQNNYVKRSLSYDMAIIQFSDICTCIWHRNATNVKNKEALGHSSQLVLHWLTFNSEQFVDVKRKAKAGISMLKCVKNGLPARERINLYYSFIEPHLTYCALVRADAGSTPRKSGSTWKWLGSDSTWCRARYCRKWADG